MARTPEQWANLSPTYKARLIRGGINEQAYLAGANLQTARGQRKEAERTAHKAARGRFTPGASTVRAWKARALARGVTPADWSTAVRSAPFAVVKAHIAAMEQRHREWIGAGAPRKYRTATRIPEAPQRPTIPPVMVPPSEYYYDDDDDTYYPADYVNEHEDEFDLDEMDYYEYDQDYDDVTEWGDSWGFYH